MARRMRLIGMFAALLLAGSAAQASDVVILDSSVGALGAGAVVDGARSVSIPAGASVTMIMADGETRLVEGPYSGPLADARGESGGAASALTSGRGGETRVLGAVRAPKWETTD